MIAGIVVGVLFFLALCLILPGFAIIGANEVGILVRKIGGGGLPAGRIVALKGENGMQAYILMPGLYWRFPIFWSFKKVAVTVINPGRIGVVESIDGEALPKNRLLGDEVECNSFQDSKAFMENGGKRGPQVAVLRPGTYRINTLLFTVRDLEATKVGEANLGIVTALDGQPLPTGYIIAPRPAKTVDHKYYQNGQAFIVGGGYRGTQLETLQPGEYYINPLLFNIKVIAVADVPPGYVVVIRSNVGIELEKEQVGPSGSTGEGKLSGPIHEDVERLLIVDKETRGIWREPVAPGWYNLNTIAYTPYLIPISAITIDWATEGRIGTEIKGTPKKYVKGLDSGDEGVLYKFDPLKVTSKDGFLLEVNVRMVIRIQPANASFIIARFGSVSNLIDQIVHPLIDASFRNKAGEKKAIDFFQSRTELQKEFLVHAKAVFAEYNVEAQNLLIAYIDIPANLLETQTLKEIALQQKAQFQEQALAQEQRIAVQEKSARADKQKDVINAELEISIKTNYAQARMREAEGEATYRQKVAAAEGMGLAEGFEAQKKAVGEESTTAINIIKALADKNIPIVPTTLVSSGDGGSMNNVIGLLLARLAKGSKETEKTSKG